MHLKHISFVALAFACCAMAKAQKTYDLKFNPAIGNHYEIQADVNTKVDEQIITIDMGLHSHMDYAIASAPDKNKKISITYESMKMTMDGMGNNLVLDSDSSDNATPNPFARLKGKSFSIIIDNKGKVIQVMGVDSIVKALDNNKMAQTFINEESLKSSLSQAFNFYPKTPVQIGSSWTSRTEISTPFKLSGDYTYTLTKVENNKAYIAINGTLSSNGLQPMHYNGMDLKMDMTGATTGNMVIDMATGMFENNHLNMAINGNVDAGGMTIPLSVNMSSDIQSSLK